MSNGSESTLDLALGLESHDAALDNAQLPALKRLDYTAHDRMMAAHVFAERDAAGRLKQRTAAQKCLRRTRRLSLSDVLGHWLLNNFGHQLWARMYQRQAELLEK